MSNVEDPSDESVLTAISAGLHKDRKLYCYKVMPFGLKNVGVTYQRLVNAMFKALIDKTMEVYVDDMLVKLERMDDHVTDLGEILECS